MNEIFEVAKNIARVLEEYGWSYCFIGGIAVLHWSEPRLTGDVDVCVFTGVENDNDLIEDLLNEFTPRIKDAAEFALQNRVLLVKQGNVGCDVSLGTLSFEEEMIEQSRVVEITQGISLRLCSPESLVVMKSFAGRTKDWMDVEGVLIRHKETLDFDNILTWLKELCEARETPENLEYLERLIQKIG